MLLYKLLLMEVDGKLYISMKSIYTDTAYFKSSISCIRINNKTTEWFECELCAKQGDCLSPLLFSVFINDLRKEVNDFDIGVFVYDRKFSMLLYADGIVLFSDSEDNLQTMLNVLHNWCKKWRVLINTHKSKCVHFRNWRTHKISFSNFDLGITIKK